MIKSSLDQIKRHMRLLIINLLLLIAVLQCEKDEKIYQFGEPDYEIVTDSVYYAQTDGILKVDLIERASPYITDSPTGWIYADGDPDPSTQVAIIYYSTSLPINKGIYWKITESNARNEFLICWTPIQNE